MKRFKLLALALAAVLVIGAVGCTSTRVAAEEDYPVSGPYADVIFGLGYYPDYWGYYPGYGYYYRPHTYFRTRPVYHGNWGGRTWSGGQGNWSQNRGEARQRVLGGSRRH